MYRLCEPNEQWGSVPSTLSLAAQVAKFHMRAPEIAHRPPSPRAVAYQGCNLLRREMERVDDSSVHAAPFALEDI